MNCRENDKFCAAKPQKLPVQGIRLRETAKKGSIQEVLYLILCKKEKIGGSLYLFLH